MREKHRCQFKVDLVIKPALLFESNYKKVDFPVNYSHPYLLNGDEGELHRSFSNETEYLIIAPSHLASPAQALADMHSDSVDVEFQLNTEVVIVDGLATNPSDSDIRNFIISRIQSNSNLKFLLLFGDENDIPPIFYDGYPSDDFYTLNRHRLRGCFRIHFYHPREWQ